MLNDKLPSPISGAFSRRNMLQIMIASGFSLLTSCGAASQNKSTSNLACIVTPEQTEGPYFVDEKLMRSDIRFDPTDGSIQEGMLLTLTINVFKTGSSACTPIKDAIVDIWHCNAEGVYSDAKDRSFDTRGRKFLRGYRLTDELGAVKFFTVYPGWYDGRAVHIHFKIRTTDASGKSHEFTSQLYFDDKLNDEVFALAPYAGKGVRRINNSNDGIYEEGGRQLMLKPYKTADGYMANFDVGLNLG
ncbi:MAG: intradiol ring-cleavage dioxygenase [Pseudomonadota bacterium]